MPLAKRAQESSDKCPAGIRPYYHRVFFSEFSITSHNCNNKSKIAQAERKAKARFQALLRRRRSSRHRLKERENRRNRCEQGAQTPADSQSKCYLRLRTARQKDVSLILPFITCYNCFVCDSLMISGTKVRIFPIASK